MAEIGPLLAGETNCDQPFIGGPDLPNICASNSSLLFLYLFNSLLAVHPKIGDPCGRVKPVRKPSFSYDFIIVGAGAAGPVIAEYLSRSPETSVTLIEAGPDTPAGSEVPSNLQMFLNTELDWKYETSNEAHACLKRGGKCKWPRGKNLGGCTSHHGMAYHRGHELDYTRWVEMGAEGWSWQEVLKYFRQEEDNREIGRVSAKDHGTGGPLTVERFPWQPSFAYDVLAAANETGFGITEDMVGERIKGFTIAQTISRNGVRLSSIDAYLKLARNRPNLHILVNTTVTKIVMNKKTAVGVEFINNGRKGSVRAKKEVIVSGGAINSPQLLLLSGIGPAEHLRSVGIRVVHDLAGVGKNLHNHVSYGLDFTLNQTVVEDFSIKNADMYLHNQTGPMSSTGMAQVTGIIASKYTTPNDPDIQIFFAGYQATCPTNGRIEDLASNGPQQTVRFTSVNLHSKSRGSISLNNKNPLSPPNIHSNELSHPQDISVILEGIHAILDLANSTRMQQLGLKLITSVDEACSKHEPFSDDYWRCDIQWNTRPENHQAGSCKMGAPTDEMAVVDPRLRVYGVKGLRVADAAVMPRVVSGNPAATIHMIGTRAAEFIAEDHNLNIKKAVKY